MPDVTKSDDEVMNQKTLFSWFLGNFNYWNVISSSNSNFHIFCGMFTIPTCRVATRNLCYYGKQECRLKSSPEVNPNVIDPFLETMELSRCSKGQPWLHVWNVITSSNFYKLFVKACKEM